MVITESVDIALILTYAFIAFFIGLVMYLRREDRREGYPLDGEIRQDGLGTDFLFFPEPKVFRTHDGQEILAPNGIADTREVKATPVDVFHGAPLEPTGDPLVDGVGPAAWAERADKPDMTSEHKPKILPLRVATEYGIHKNDQDPRGLDVIDRVNAKAGTVTDIWVDHTEFLARYYEMEVDGTDGKKVLIPVLAAAVDKKRNALKVPALFARNFPNAPVTKSPDQVTLLEEDKIMGYFGGGYLLADPKSKEPLI